MLVLLLQTLETEEDKSVFTEIYLENEQLIFKAAEYLLNDKSCCADCVQETFLELIKSFENFKRIEPGKQKNYILTICRRCAYKINRNESGIISLDDAPECEFPVESDISGIELRKIIDAIKGLDEMYRIPLSMKYTEGKSIKEISKFLSISENAVKQRLYRGRKMIFKALETEAME